MNRKKAVLLVMLLGVFVVFSSVNAQDKEPKKSPKAKASLTIGIDTEVTFEFSSPGVKGRTIFGDLVPWGLTPGNKYSDEKPFPWRGGANENTTIAFNHDLTIAGNKVPAGKYSLHFVPDEKEWTVMLNSVNDQWGSYKYDAAKDVAKFKVAPAMASSQELLTYGFEDYTGYTVTAYLHWAKVKIPFKLEVAK
jgi:Protein of unknown function (DUF2911)